MMNGRRCMEVKVTNNAQIFIDAKNEAVAFALEAIGLTAERYAKADCPVDTGRLRNSISHAVNEGEQTAYIGTDVEYAKYVELKDSLHHNTGKAHFLRDAASKHGTEYKRIAENILRNA